MTFEFQSIPYRTADEMLSAIAKAWLKGANSSAELEVAWANTDEELAAEAIEDFGLAHADDPCDCEAQSHMEAHGYGQADLAAAFAALRPAPVTLDAINPWSGVCVTLDVTHLTQRELDAYQIDRDEADAVAAPVDATPGQWLAAWADMVGPERAGIAVIGS